MSRHRISIPVGARFGHWLVISETFAIGRLGAALCRCDCSNVRSVSTYALRSGKSAGCGCYLSKRKHGHNSRTETSLTYNSWVAMKARCSNPNSFGYHNYGGRGIAICERWQASFTAFLDDMGERPSKSHSIDRYPDRNGNYEPSNCRWATAQEQARNSRQNTIVAIGGVSRCIEEWCEIYGIKSSAVHMRISKGMDPIQAITTPAGSLPNPHLVLVTIDGQTRTITQWCGLTGINRQTAYYRISRGWNAVDAVTKSGR